MRTIQVTIQNNFLFRLPGKHDHFLRENNIVIAKMEVLLFSLKALWIQIQVYQMFQPGM
jgi:hypothetical protein